MKRSPAAGTPWGLRLLVTWFLVGEAAPVAPATAASLLVLPILYPYLGLDWPIQAAITLVLCWIAILASTQGERAYGHDAKAIVIDEVVGMLVTFLALPAPEGGSAKLLVLAAGFVLFRIFDVLKPFPANRAQNLPGGQGVVMDDVAAGVYANVVLRVGLLVL